MESEITKIIGKSTPIEIHWDNLTNYLNERDGKNLTVEQWKEHFSTKKEKE